MFSDSTLPFSFDLDDRSFFDSPFDDREAPDLQSRPFDYLPESPSEPTSPQAEEDLSAQKPAYLKREPFLPLQRQALADWISNNGVRPAWPELVGLAEATGLTRRQVQVYFVNYRCRHCSCCKETSKTTNK
jgi:hypothetical protein